MEIQFTANLTGYTYHYYPVPDQSQYQQPYWKLFDSFAWADYTVDFFFKNTPGTDNYVEGNYGTFPMLTNYKNNDAEDPRNTCGLVRWDNTNIFVQSGIPHAGFGYGVLGLGDNKQYRLRINKFDSFTNYDSLTDLEADTTTSWYSTADEAHSLGTLELFSSSIGIQFQGLDFYDLNGILVKSFRPYRYNNQDYLYESVEDKYYGPDGSSPVSTLPGSDVQPNNVVARPSKLLLIRRNMMVPTLSYERLAYIYLNQGTYYELDQLGTHYETWTVDCVFKYTGTASGNGQYCWGWAIDVPTKRRLGCTFFTKYSSSVDCNCGWADGYGHGNDDGWLGGFTGSGTVQVYGPSSGWGNIWYRGVSMGASNSWSRYNNYVPSIENPYSGTYASTTTVNNPSRVFGSYNSSNAENATAMTPFCLGDIRLYPGNTLSSFQYPPSQMFVYFAAWKLTIGSQVIAEYLPVLVDGTTPCILNTATNHIFYPQGTVPTYSKTF